MTTYNLMDGQAGRPGVGSSGTQPPTGPTAATGGWLLGTTAAAVVASPAGARDEPWMLRFAPRWA